jgi:hypothetical protein
MRMRSAIAVLLPFLLAAAPLPDVPVPGERTAGDPAKWAATTEKELASGDPAVYKPAMGSILSIAHSYLQTLTDRMNQPGVDPQAKSRFDHAVKIRKPIDDAAAIREKSQAALRTAIEKQLQKAYDSSSRKNPKWDADVEAGFGYYIRSLHGGNAVADRNYELRSAFYLDRAITAGCDDPAVLVVDSFARGKTTAVSAAQEREAAVQADEADHKSPTSPYFKILINRRILRQFASDPSRASEVQPRMNDMVEQLKKLCDDPDVNGRMAREMAHDVDECATLLKLDRYSWFEKYYPVLEAKYPQSGDVLTLKGGFYIDYAWEGRGTAYAGKTTEAQFKLLHDRLVTAREALEQSWSLDPTVEQTPVLMLKVCMGSDAGRDDMEEWFKRGVKLAPTMLELYESKMLYLQPKWHGSVEEMIAFGRECRGTEYYHTTIPLQLVQAHKAVAGYTSDPVAYLAQPDVWKDIASAYEQILEYKPKDLAVRVGYAEIAARESKWATANEQFKLAGDLPAGSPPDAVTEYNYLRKKAARQAENGN